MKLALALAGYDTTPADCSSASYRAPDLGRLGKKTLSQSSEATTCSGDSEGGLSCASSVVEFRTVRFSSQVDIVEVERFTVAEIIGSREHGTCWSDMASWRQNRFRICVHSSRRCRQRACCHAGDGLCSRGGSLASEAAVGLAEVFGAWRIFQGIPATVPFAVMNRGRCWPA
jgi:hypothetical protein